jgi:SAM-dependent methyltransferase
MVETNKSKKHRISDGWFDKYIRYPGIDIGSSNDPIDEKFDLWDFCLGNTDATYMEGVSDNKYKTVYCSHIIEHLYYPLEGIKNWYRILASGGHLIILAPHRDLYEKRKKLPSRWNSDHKTFWLPEEYEPPNTFSLKHTILQAIPNANIVSLNVLNEDWCSESDLKHSNGEYSIEIIVRKD